MVKGLVVSRVLEGGIAEEMEIEIGDIICKVDGQQVNDILDLQYYTAEREFVLTIKKNTGEIWDLEIIQESGEFLGLEFKKIAVDGLKTCSNNCVFCFVHQMPPGLRDSLYVRDDDYRLSFTQGSYITLTNLTSAEFQRIIDLHLSPLFISVQAWDPEERIKLMKNKRAGVLAEQIKILAQNGIVMHTQIVLVPGYNDGEVLEETVNNLAAFYPAVQSIGVVPVGLTKHRSNLPQLRAVSPEEAGRILEQGVKWQKGFKERTGRNLVYFADEFYILGKRAFPSVKEYDGFPQLENGIGMAAKFRKEVCSYLSCLPPEVDTRRVHILTGVSAYGYFEELLKELAFIKGLKLTLHPVINRFFGESVTVAGLLTAQDIAAQVGDLEGDYFLIPKVMLKADEDVFLDGHTVEWLAEKINGQAIIVYNEGKSFLEGVLGEKI
ncbi:MAG: DUF512 domain-containing protein [Desulfitobacteriia bacterium]